METFARILADSISDRDIRLTTLEVNMPRYLLSEYNTHRLFSRNSASSRAIPPEKHLHGLLDDPFIPVEFYTRTKGMGQDEPLTGEKREDAERGYLRARTDAVYRVLGLLTTREHVRWAIHHRGGREDGLRYVIDEIAEAVKAEDVPDEWLNVSKSTVNRILEPYMRHTVIVTSTEWDNFFSLRAPVEREVDLKFPAEPEIQRVAIAMRQAMRESTPHDLGPGDWHTPMVEGGYVGKIAAEFNELFWPKVSAGRCARVSFDTHDKTEDEQKSLGRAEGLTGSFHLSPTEHTATPFSEGEWDAREAMAEEAQIAYGRAWIDQRAKDQLIAQTAFKGNFRGWTQLRKLIDHEWDGRGHMEQREPWDHAGLPEALAESQRRGEV
jgi:hypothetical protein